MRARFILPLLLILAAPAFAADPPIRLPVAPVVPAPMPGPPAAVTKLTADQLYVIDSDADCFVLASPAGLVSVTEGSGPVKMFGKFAGGNGEYEWKEFKGKKVIVVQAVVTGRVELMVVPVGASKAADVIRVTLDTDAQNPTPPPKPKPEPPKPEPVTSFRVIFVYESANALTASQNSVMYGKTVSDFLNAKTTPEGKWAGWNRFDQHVTGETLPTNLKALWLAIKPSLTAVPCMAVEVNGKVDIVPLPATPAEAVAILTKYAEGK